jgi:guanosine-3',5'-bis(diphosphate) 3'-pyrophosphohydrolase
VREAYKFADEAHLGQFRASGQPYITHPLAVAGLCADWKLDAQAIMAALMHDTIEDQGIKKSELIEKFGGPTADLVDGLTKLDKLHFSTREESQAESFRKMLLAMARDVRVILIKLADRLHNMRTMQAMAPAKRHRIARETLDIYAPIRTPSGPEPDVPRAAGSVLRTAATPGATPRWPRPSNARAGHRRDIVERVQKEVEKAFAQQKIKVQVSGPREDHLQHLLQDARKARRLCAGVRHLRLSHRRAHADRLLCRAGCPAPVVQAGARALQGLHRHPQGQRLPEPAHHAGQPAGHGGGVPDAHRRPCMRWPRPASRRTGSTRAAKGPRAARQRTPSVLSTMWLQSLLEIQDETRDAAEFLEHVKIDLYPDAVYVFTPRSKILALPRGATPVDFAYAIHSDVGQHTVAAKINGEPAALRTELKSGDVVEIITAPGARPNPAWLSMVRTGRARSKIRQYLKNMEAEESRAMGEKMLAQALRAEGLHLPSPDPTDSAAAALWQQLTRWSGNRHRGELLVDIGLGRKIAVIVAKRLAQLMLDRGIKPDAVTLTLGRYGQDDTVTSQGVVFVDGSEGNSIQLAPCCRPIPGDAIVGYLGRGEGLLVHTAECPTGKRLFERDSERWMQVEWADDLARPFETSLHVLVKNGKGALAQIASSVSSAEADIVHLDMDPEPGEENIELRLLVSVRDRVHLAEVLRTLRRAPVVQRVSRYRQG